MRWFIVWNDTWRWSHSSHLLKINFAKAKPFMKSGCDVVQIPHVAPRTLHAALHRCYRITWQHYRRMWAKINRVVVWFIHRWYILKASSSYSNGTACSRHAGCRRLFKKKKKKRLLLTQLATVTCSRLSGCCPPRLQTVEKWPKIIF